MNEIAAQQALDELYQAIRSKTETLCEPLVTEDYITQSIEDVSPPKWHLAHTSWFFETFILLPHQPSYKPFDPLFAYLFNSYYNGVGAQFPRSQRGILSRPTVETIYDYRNYVDAAVANLLEQTQEHYHLIELGLHHEQQHQELLLMDIKHNFFMHPHFPAYQKQKTRTQQADIPKLNFIALEGGLIEVGHQGKGFCYDNELPRHQKFIYSYQIADRLVTNGEYLEFIEAGGYQNPTWWLMDGWIAVKHDHWQSPLYWQRIEHEWYEFTLSGLRKLNLNEPVTHVSYYEANAYANWKNKRLPTEEEWENFVTTKQSLPQQGNFMEANILHPTTQAAGNTQAWGDVWEWTSSEYQPYPGFKPFAGIASEYNGKFMHNQKVLRGGACVTPQSHIRSSYRNYFGCDKRWQFSGIRLVSDK